MSLQYISDNTGKKTAVIIPISEWNALKSKYKNIDFENGDSKKAVLSNIERGVKEVKLAQQGKLKTTLAKDFFNEL